MGMVDLEDDIPESQYEYKPVLWVNCPGCGKGLKSTWLLKTDEQHCENCGTIVRYRIVSHFDVLIHENAVHGAETNVRRSGKVWFPCQGCDARLNTEWVIRQDDYTCRECDTHHHLEVVFEDIGEVSADTWEICLLCEEKTPAGLMNDHHVAYEPDEITIRVCRECHRRIHHEVGYHDELEPETIPDCPREKIESRSL